MASPKTQRKHARYTCFQVAVWFDFVFYESLWGPPAGWLFFLMQQFIAPMIRDGICSFRRFCGPWMRAQRHCPGAGQVFHQRAAHNRTPLKGGLVTALEEWEII